ncbi:mitochondrial import inner membrane translocase subunit tim21 [Microsporum ferrugineum]
MNSSIQLHSLRSGPLFVRLVRNSGRPVSLSLTQYNHYATQSSLNSSKSAQPTRKSITVTSDDGTIKWGQLSRGEKAARATQQSVNFLVILAGAVMTVSGPLNDGVVLVHLVKLAGQHDFEYHLLALDVKGHRRIYLENVDAAKKAAAKAGSTIFGIQWR